MLILFRFNFVLLTRLHLFNVYDAFTLAVFIVFRELCKDNYMSRKLMQFVVRLFAALSLGLTLTQVYAKTKPNVLFIFADDQCFETVGKLGLTDIDTPNLDRLATRGMQFTRAYNMGSWSGAVCVASRHMLITGRHIWRAQKAQQVLRGGKKMTDAQKKARD